MVPYAVGVLFERRLRDGINAGTVTVAFRRWRRRQVTIGGRYRTGSGGWTSPTRGPCSPPEPT